MVVGLLAALVLGAVHVVAGRAHHLRGAPRSWVLSAGSGISVAYVFLHLLPEVAGLSQELDQGALGWWVALGGLAAVYGLELLGRRSSANSGEGDGAGAAVVAHLGSYTLYNGVVGYLVLERARVSQGELWLFVVAMALHFLVNDHGLREHHSELYDRVGRWCVAAGVLAGAAIGVLVQPPALAVEAVIAFLAGGVVMNVLKEELPEDQSSRWTPFVLAAAAYGLLLAAV